MDLVTFEVFFTPSFTDKKKKVFELCFWQVYCSMDNHRFHVGLNKTLFQTKLSVNCILFTYQKRAVYFYEQGGAGVGSATKQRHQGDVLALGVLVGEVTRTTAD